jgi:hypothetical protein
MGISVFPAASGGVIRKSTTFTSSGTFTLPAGYGAGQPLIVDIEICGGGGGGGSGAATTAESSTGGTGGASGVTTVYRNVALTANATVTIGAGGTGGSARTATQNGIVGASGGASNVDSIYYAPGGGGGTFGQTQNSPTTLKGLGVHTYGFNIPGGYSTSDVSPGAGGGSGSGYSANINSGQTPFYYGGSRGSAGVIVSFVGDGVSSISDTTFNIFNILQGRGLSAVNTIGSSGTITQGSLPGAGSNEILLLQRGAGGSGGKGNNNGVAAGGGAAGTRFTGGQSGYNDSLSITGSKNGGTATDPGCGGGGGGGGYSLTSGSGGAGAAGYCIIYYWG